MQDLASRIRAALDSPDPDHTALLDMILAHFECVTGTIHRLEPEGRALALLAARGVPDAVLPKIQLIPVGRGMAGLAAERRQPLQVCNLQADETGAVRPGARETQMKGSITCPILVDGELRGTLGIARPTEYEFTPEQIAELMQVGAEIGRSLAS